MKTMMKGGEFIRDTRRNLDLKKKVSNRVALKNTPNMHDDVRRGCEATPKPLFV
jgi:hypothetical protein